MYCLLCDIKYVLFIKYYVIPNVYYLLIII